MTAAALAFAPAFFLYSRLSPLGASLLCGAAFVAAWLIEWESNRVWRPTRAALLAASTYLLATVLAFIPFDRASRDFEEWHRKRQGGVLPGMTQGEAERALRQRSSFTASRDGEWITYELEPAGVAAWNPLRRVAYLGLYKVNARVDPITSLITEVDSGGQ